MQSADITQQAAQPAAKLVYNLSLLNGVSNQMYERFLLKHEAQLSKTYLPYTINSYVLS